MSQAPRTEDYVAHFDKARPNHRAWLQGVLDRLIGHDPEALAEGSELRLLWTGPGDTENSWAGVSTAAAAAGARFPELVAAQWALESGHGKHTSGRNNFFGLKGSGAKQKTTEYEAGKPVQVEASFLDFPSLGAAIAYLVDRWYKDFKTYKGVNRAADRNAAARLLVSEGYATDPRYAEKLIRLMDEQAPASKPAPPVNKPAAGLDPRTEAERGLIGPGKAAPVGAGDSYLLVNDRTETMRAYSHVGELMWEIPCLARGQGADSEWKRTNTDTPPGLYRIGQIYRDYERNAKPAQSDDAMAYGWYSFDLVELENQEARHGRAGIMIHGGGSACGWPGAWAARQRLFPTLGCVRCHNQDLRDKVLPLTAKGTVYVGVFQEG